MWVVGSADCLARAIDDRSHLVDEQEGVEQVQAGCGQRTADDEPATFQLALGGDDLDDLTDLRHLQRLSTEIEPVNRSSD
jgi:hypothetical protein